MNQPSRHHGTTTDGQPVTIRPRRDLHDVFVGGWRVAILKTERGAERRADLEVRRERKTDERPTPR